MASDDLGKFGLDVAPSQCSLCRHRRDGLPAACDAFPAGIPFAIQANEADHRRPIEGDGGIRFEARDGVDRRGLERLVAALDGLEEQEPAP